MHDFKDVKICPISNIDLPLPVGTLTTTHKWCDTCKHCDYFKSIGRQPQTRYCTIYTRLGSDGKPDEVIYKGGECKYYEKMEGYEFVEKSDDYIGRKE